MRKLRRKRVAVASMAVALAAAGSAAAFQQLPAADQVNNDAPAGVSARRSESMAVSRRTLMWSAARLSRADRLCRGRFSAGHRFARSDLRAVVRRPASGQRAGNGTVGGRPARARRSAGSLNFDQGQDGEVPAIDFAGAGRTMPWATWYEHTTGIGFGQQQHLRQPVRQHGRREPEQVDLRRPGPGNRAARHVQVPSLNIHTDQDAENPSVAGGSAVDRDEARSVGHLAGDDDLGPVNGKDQIFVCSAARTESGCEQLRRGHPGGNRRRDRSCADPRWILLAADRRSAGRTGRHRIRA